MARPSVVLCAEDSRERRFSRPPSTRTATSNSRTEPLLIVTPVWPAVLSMPMSQDTPSGHDGNSEPSPATVWPFRSSVMSSAPITIPLFGQLTRSAPSLVSAVIVTPQLTRVGSACATAGVRNPATTTAAHIVPKGPAKQHQRRDQSLLIGVLRSPDPNKRHVSPLLGLSPTLRSAHERRRDWSLPSTTPLAAEDPDGPARDDRWVYRPQSGPFSKSGVSVTWTRSLPLMSAV
jgi:hypothetical protein